jgi:hypothetical protein
MCRGDLTAGTVLVDHEGRPAGVIDFGGLVRLIRHWTSSVRGICSTRIGGASFAPSSMSTTPNGLAEGRGRSNNRWAQCGTYRDTNPVVFNMGLTTLTSIAYDDT